MFIHPKPEANQSAAFFHVLRKQRRWARAGVFKCRNGVNTPLALQGLPRDCGAGQTDSSKPRDRQSDKSPIMKHSHHHENLRSAGLQLKQKRSESTHPTTRPVPGAGTSDDSQPEVGTRQSAGDGQVSGTLSDQQRELRQASEGNKDFSTPIQSFWPTPSA